MLRGGTDFRTEQDSAAWRDQFVGVYALPWKVLIPW